MDTPDRGSNYANVRANRLAFHPGSRHSQEPGNFGWLLEGQLAGCAIPTSTAHLQTLKLTHNIGLLCSLIESSSCPPLELFEPGETTPESLHIEWRDMSVPTRQQMDQLLSLTQEYIEKGMAVAYHCFGGKGRTGTALACYLLKFQPLDGFTAETAIQYVRELRPNSIETSSQELFIQNYERYLKKEPLLKENTESSDQPKWFTIQLRKTGKTDPS